MSDLRQKAVIIPLNMPDEPLSDKGDELLWRDCHTYVQSGALRR
jgi:hypothetical protein